MGTVLEYFVLCVTVLLQGRSSHYLSSLSEKVMCQLVQSLWMDVLLWWLLKQYNLRLCDSFQCQAYSICGWQSEHLLYISKTLRKGVGKLLDTVHFTWYHCITMKIYNAIIVYAPLQVYWIETCYLWDQIPHQISDNLEYRLCDHQIKIHMLEERCCWLNMLCLN